MSMLIAIPVFRIGCKVEIDRGRVWSVVDEVVLWAITQQPKSISALSQESNLPSQVIIASVARMMRFRLVEVILDANDVAFRASDYGFKVVSSGAQLPSFPKRISRRVNFVIERASGEFFPTRQIRVMSKFDLEREQQSGIEVRIVSIEGGGPPMSSEANLNRLSDIAARGWDEQIALVEGRTSTLSDNQFMTIRVIDGLARDIPESAGAELRQVISKVAALPGGTAQFPVTYAGHRESIDTEAVSYACSFDPADLIIGGSAQRACFESLVSKAHRRVIILSTFLSVQRFADLKDIFRAACLRGIMFDLFWGAAKDDETEQRGAVEASAIAAFVRDDKDMCGRVRVHMRTTGSHAKLMMVDTAQDGWIATVGSCNWLSSPFQAVELTVVLRDQRIVADVATVLQQLVGRRGLSDDTATELAFIARDLRRAPAVGGLDRVTLVIGDAHDRLIRAASSEAKSRFVVGSNRLGSTARPGALIQGEAAAKRDGVRSTVIYTQPTGPVKNRHARILAEEAQRSGFRLIKTKKIPLHGKFLAWDVNDLVVTSLNWASASSDPDFPWGEVGVCIHASGIAESTLEKLEAVFPELSEYSVSTETD